MGVRRGTVRGKGSGCRKDGVNRAFIGKTNRERKYVWNFSSVEVHKLNRGPSIAKVCEDQCEVFS